jgi:capsular polysaccharide export protein
LRAAAALHDIPVSIVEDGFLRSVGLGADFMPAASLVVDGAGIYYDPTRPSELEAVLRDTAFDAALVERARRLIQVLVARGITKYNIGSGAVPDLAAPAGARRILVPGQVEDDRSVLLGGAGVAGNLDLLQRVRAANPDAVIVYKPHPDVDAGHRRGAIPDAAAAALADHVVRDVSSAALLAVIDEVHTLTSLVGFEALLRGRRVTVYGQPFYAGWGLTEDRHPPPRRGRRLRLEELVAGALILYPRYLDPVTRLPCGPEVIIDRLSDPSLWRAGPLVSARRLQGLAVQRLKRWSANLFARRAAL